jgi:predicted Zn-dependent protease
MDACEPRVRRRGFFLHSSDTEVETGEHENAEGVAVRVRTGRSTAPRRFSSSGRQARTEPRTDEGQPQIRSGSVTGSRQRAHLPR